MIRAARMLKCTQEPFDRCSDSRLVEHRKPRAHRDSPRIDDRIAHAVAQPIDLRDGLFDGKPTAIGQQIINV